MMRALKGLSIFGGLAVVLTLLFVMGCSDNTPVQPDVPNAQNLGLIMDEASEEMGGSYETYDSAYIEASEGGKITIERETGVHTFVVERYSIKESTLITVKTENQKVLEKNMVVFEFGPDGLSFGKPARLRFDMGEFYGNTNTAYLYYYDPIRKGWRLLDSVQAQNGVAEFGIDHFSKYAISD
jgi:hypothetical protein